MQKSVCALPAFIADCELMVGLGGTVGPDYYRSASRAARRDQNKGSIELDAIRHREAHPAPKKRRTLNLPAKVMNGGSSGAVAANTQQTRSRAVFCSLERYFYTLPKPGESKRGITLNTAQYPYKKPRPCNLHGAEAAGLNS
jgi:hypothetical protein